MIVKNRIKKHHEFQKVIANGQYYRTNSFAFYILENAFDYTRIGISVPKKSGNAVVRNKIKRQVRACIAQLTDYSKPLDIVMIIKRGFDVEQFNKTKNEIRKLFEKVGNISEENK